MGPMPGYFQLSFGNWPSLFMDLFADHAFIVPQRESLIRLPAAIRNQDLWRSPCRKPWIHLLGTLSHLLSHSLAAISKSAYEVEVERASVVMKWDRNRGQFSPNLFHRWKSVKLTANTY